MAVKKFEKDLKEKVIECLNENMKRNDIVDKLVIDFPKASKSMIHKYIDEYKEEIKSVAADSYTEAIDKLTKEGADKEVMIGVANVFEGEIEEEKKVIEKDKVEISNLKIKDFNLIIEGENGEYKANIFGVTLFNKENNVLAFPNEIELDKWVSEIREVFKKVNEVTL